MIHVLNRSLNMALWGKRFQRQLAPTTVMERLEPSPIWIAQWRRPTWQVT